MTNIPNRKIFNCGIKDSYTLPPEENFELIVHNPELTEIEKLIILLSSEEFLIAINYYMAGANLYNSLNAIHRNILFDYTVNQITKIDLEDTYHVKDVKIVVDKCDNELKRLELI